jgi:putative membrane protein
MKTLLALLALAGALNHQPTTLAAQEKKGNANIAVSDRNFVLEAADGGRVEVELGKLAQQKGASGAVKQFGERMAADHDKANGELMSIAGKLGFDVPRQIGKKHEATMKRFASLSGASFDAAYAKQMLADHESTIALFEQQAKKGQAAELKAFAEKSLPTLREHLEMARALPGK